MAEIATASDDERRLDGGAVHGVWMGWRCKVRMGEMFSCRYEMMGQSVGYSQQLKLVCIGT